MYLILFSYVILCDFYPIYNNRNKQTSLGLPISVPEVVLIIWTTTFLFEEISQFLNSERKLIKARFLTFFTDFWNLIDQMALFFFIVAIILRFIPYSYNFYLAARYVIKFTF